MNTFSLQSEAKKLQKAGYKLIELKEFTKQPKGQGWNTALTEEIDINPRATGYGLHLASSGLCSIDPDYFELAKAGFEALSKEFNLGMTLEELLDLGVRTSSTRPNSGGRSTFTSHQDLNWVKFSCSLYGTMLEFRANAKNLQDCIPGTVYKDQKTGEIYHQQYSGNKTLTEVSTLPSLFLEFWKSISIEPDTRRAAQLVFNKGVAESLGISEGDLGGHLDVSAGGKLAFYSKKHTPEFNRNHRVKDFLDAHGYNAHGERYSAPKASGSPAIRLITDTDDLWHSDHASDSLFGTFDAWTCYVVLEHNSNMQAAEEAYSEQQAMEIIEEFGDLPSADNSFLDGSYPKATKFVLDGILSEGISVLASYPGGGKTTAMVSLVACVTGALVEGPFKTPPATIKPRKVIYFSEHPEQVELIIQAMVKENMIDVQRLKERLHIAPAQRIKPEKISKLAEQYVDKKYLNTVTRNNVTIEATPWLIFDTTSAVIDLEDENSNSEWGKAISALKNSFVLDKQIPITLVAHTAKNGKDSSDATKLTTRGGSALEGDATQIMFLVKDKQNNRYINIGDSKHRFTPKAHALEIDSSVVNVTAINEFEETVEESVLVCDLNLLTREEFESRQSQDTSSKYSEIYRTFRGDLLDQIRENERLMKAISASRFKTLIRKLKVPGLGNTDKVNEFVEWLLEERGDFVELSSEDYDFSRLGNQITFSPNVKKLIVTDELQQKLGVEFGASPF